MDKITHQIQIQVNEQPIDSRARIPNVLLSQWNSLQNQVAYATRSITRNQLTLPVRDYIDSIDENIRNRIKYHTLGGK